MRKNYSNTPRVFGLDVMRVVAIVLVLIGHTLWIFPSANSLIGQLLTVFGFLGVEVFFVLSGFLIGSILYDLFVKEHFGFKQMFQFLKRRWLRTLPNYYLILIVNIVIASLIHQSTQGVWRYFFFLQNGVCPMPFFFPESWSLSVEEYAYVILPLALVLVVKGLPLQNRNQQFLLVVICLLIFFFCTKLYYHYTTTNTTLLQWNLSLKAVVMYRVDAILMGVLFAWFAKQSLHFWQKIKFPSLVVALLIFILIFIGVGYFQWLIQGYPLFWNVFYLPIISFGIALCLPWLSQWKTTTLPLAFIVQKISILSYSVYLIHYSLVLQLMKYFFPTEGFSTTILWIYTLLYISITFMFSHLLYRFFEKPIMDLRDVF
jgi:peptidoglycan/LPS O-acetylase OafA/YrhL